VRLTENLAAQIRKAKAAGPGARVSDFQIRVDADRTALINLKTGDVRIIPASHSGELFAEFCERAEQPH
jgi:hypothetical protein